MPEVADNPGQVLDALSAATYEEGFFAFLDFSSKEVAVEAALRSSFIGVRVKRSTAQTIPNTTDTAISFDGEDYDVGGFHDAGSNPSRCTVPARYAGKYLVTANFIFATDAGTGFRRGKLRVNGTTVVADVPFRPVAGNVVGCTLATQVVLAASDYVELVVWHSVGGDQDVNANTAHLELSLL